MQPAITLDPMASSATVKGYTPAQIDKAYGFDSITLDNGLGGTVAGDGSGQTIAIVDAFNDPNIAHDLKTFDKQFSLTDPNLTVVNQNGSTIGLPKTDAGWAEEISLDVEWAHAVAPKANIELVEAKSASLSDLLAAVDTARNADGVSVVSMSWGTNEFFNEGNLDKYFTTPAGHQGVSFVASAGDEGSFFGPTWPSVSSNVLAVGGTTLSLNADGTIASETGWSDSGGGVSRFESQPDYQSQYNPNFSTRGAPDVSIDANPNTGYAVYDSLAFQGHSGWMEIGGTSAGAPQWGALIAIANQGRKLLGGGTLDGATGTLPALYSFYDNNADYAAHFNDIVHGASSFFNRAAPGWDGVTGFGSPKGDAIADGLSHFGLTISTPTSGTVTPTTGKQTTPAPAHKTSHQSEAAHIAAVTAPTAALPAAQQIASLFSSTPLRTTADVVSTVRSTPARGSDSALGDSGDGSGSGLAGSAGGRGGQQIAFVQNHVEDDSTPIRWNGDNDVEASPLRRLLSHHDQPATMTDRPGKMFAPSTYDAAAFAATRDNSDDWLNWKQIAALVGTTILVGSYAVESNRRKRAIQTI